MADDPSDACSRTDGDGARASRNNKRKSSRACSYPNKKHGFIIRNQRELYLIHALAAVVFMVIGLFNDYVKKKKIYLFTEDESDEEGEEEGEEEQEDEGEESDGEEEEESDGEEEEEEEEEDDEDHGACADPLEGAVDCFIATKAWVERELGPENANCQEILGMLRLIPGYDEAVKRQKRKR